MQREMWREWNRTNNAETVREYSKRGCFSAGGEKAFPVIENAYDVLRKISGKIS